MSFVKLSLAAVLLAVQVARADHVVTFKNSCPFPLQPMWKGNSDGANAHKTNAPIPAGGSAQAVLPEIWNSGRIFAQDPKHSCAEPDGGNCTLWECSFGPSSNGQRWWQCNISLVSGFNVPGTLKFVGGKDESCKVAFSCLSGSCPTSQAYRQEGCEQCINQCNTDNVGLSIEFCQHGATIPNMGQVKTADPKPQSSASRTVPHPTPATSSKPPASSQSSSSKPPTSQPTSPAAPDSLTGSTNVGPKPSTKLCPSRANSRARRARRAHKRAARAHASSGDAL